MSEDGDHGDTEPVDAVSHIIIKTIETTLVLKRWHLVGESSDLCSGLILNHAAPDGFTQTISK